MKQGNATVNILKKAITLIVMVVVVIFIIKEATKAYAFGYAVFMDESMTSEDDARVITITIAEGDSVLDIGKMLERRGMIDNAYVFFVQSFCYESGRKIAPGSYDLTTDMNSKAIFNAIDSQSSEKDGEKVK